MEKLILDHTFHSGNDSCAEEFIFEPKIKISKIDKMATSPYKEILIKDHASLTLESDHGIIDGHGACKSCSCRGFKDNLLGTSERCKTPGCGHHYSQHR